MRIAIAADHNGYALKTELAEWLSSQGYEVDVRGTHVPEVVDYPPLCAEICHEVVERRADYGIVVGGSGQGEQIACNKVRGVRAGLCDGLFAAEISRSHNDANVLVIGAKLVTSRLAKEITSIWLTTAFEGGRHKQRLDQIAAIERGEPL